MRALRLESEHESDVVSVLADAFRDYPVFRHVLGPSGMAADRLNRLIGLFVYRRIHLGGPMLGVRDEVGRLVGAAVMTLPAEPEPSPEVIARRDETFEALGNDCRERHDAYSAVAKTLMITEPHHHLNMIGVRHDAQGQGYARPLLEAAFELTTADPKSPGLTLTTELPKNVKLYEHFGFRVTGHARVASDLESWGMFKPRQS